jgi:pimeloyl-ACP methyl ester carboxylesterase
MGKERSKSWKRRLWRYASLAAGIYLLWLGLLYLQQDSMVFPRQFAGPPLKEGRLPDRMESIWITAPRGERIEAWFMPPEILPGVMPQTPAPVVIYCHGNAELIDDNEGRAREWSRRGFAVLLPEYRGYGRSGGEPSQSAITEDLLRFYDLLIARPEIDKTRVYFHGRSLGGGIAAQIAARRPTAGLILESTFTSIASFAWGLGGVPWIVKHPFRTDVALRGYDKPVLIFHGVDDEIIPVSHGRALKRLLPRAVYMETAGDHMNYPPDVGAFWKSIDSWLER